MTDKVLMNEMNWVDYRKRVVEDECPVLLPIGATEQHGPHLPMGTDWMIATAVAKESALRVGGVVAQTITFGYKSSVHGGGGNHFCGTTSLDGITLIRLVADLLGELVRHGARKIAMVDIHYENHWFVTEACDIAVREARREGINNLRIIKPRLEAVTNLDLILPFYEPGTFPGMALEHAGKLETSVMLHIHPEHVNVEAYPTDVLGTPPGYDCYPINPDHSTESGVLAPIADANVELGKVAFDDLVNGISNCIEEEFDRKGRS